MSRHTNPSPSGGELHPLMSVMSNSNIRRKAMRSSSSKASRMSRASSQDLVQHKASLASDREGSISSEHSRELGPDALLDPFTSYKIRPFDLQWCFGADVDVPIANLTTKTRTEILYVCNNVLVLYNYGIKDMVFMQGHHNKIVSLSYEESGEYAVTADRGEDHCLLIWDTVKRLPIFTIFEPYPESGVLLVSFSRNGKFMISIGESTDYIVDFWLWTEARIKPDDTVRIRSSLGPPKDVAFNPDIQEHIMIVFETNIALIVWDEEEEKLINLCIPNLRNKHKIGNLTGGTYVMQCHECYASCENGCVLKFGNTLYTRPFDEGPLCNTKIFINMVKISEGSVTYITSRDE